MRSIRWLLPRLGLAVLIPLLLVGMTEMVMRRMQTGLPTSFFVRAEVDGVASWVNNPFYGYRFFHPDLARNPAPIRVSDRKPADTVRVVVLGESAAQGDPQIEFSLARVLEKILYDSAAHPTRFEVVNAAMTAINSHILVDIASELHRLQPDFVVLYG